MDLSYVSKANALKRKAVDVKNGIKKMGETLSMLQKNEKNYSLKTLIYYSTKNLTKSHTNLFSWQFLIMFINKFIFMDFVDSV